MLRSLADLCEIKLVDPIVEQIVDSESEGTFKRCGGGKSCSERDVSCEDYVEPFYLAASFNSFAANAKDIASPLLLGNILLLEAKFDKLIIIDGESVDFLHAVWLDCGNDSAVDCSGEYISSVIVCMFAYQIDSARRSIKVAFF